MGRRKSKGLKSKRDKLVIEFDEKKRADFLTGFKRRKDERRKKAKEEVQQMLKAAKKRVKSKLTPESLADIKDYGSVSADVTDVADKQTYELPQHWVTVTEITDVDLASSTGTYLGRNEDAGKVSDDEPSHDHEAAHDRLVTKGMDDKKSMKRRLLEASGKKRTKRHISFTHSHHKHKKLDSSQRYKLKSKMKNKHRRGGKS